MLNFFFELIEKNFRLKSDINHYLYKISMKYRLFNKTLLVLIVSLSVNSKICAQNSYSISGKIDYSGPQKGQLNVKAWPSDSQNKVLNLDGNGDFVETDITDLSGSEITIQYWFKGVSNQSAVRVQSGAGWIVAGWNGKHILHNDDVVNGVSIGENYNDGE